MNDDRSGSRWSRGLEKASSISSWYQQIRQRIEPLVQRLWQNTERRDQARRERIAAWRSAVDRDDFEYRGFANSDAYAALRGYLPDDLKQEIDQWRNPHVVVIPPTSGRGRIQSRLLEEIARIEQDWGLI